MKYPLVVPVFLCSIFAAAILKSEASSIPRSAHLHRRFTFLAKSAPANWSTSGLEDYDQYHFRFLTLGCHQKRDKEDFFKDCCHPRLKDEDLATIPVQCQLDPASIIKAHEYIVNSTLGKGEVDSGVGKAVYVQKDSIKTLQPVSSRNASDLPTKKQLDELLKAQAKVDAMDKSLNLTSSNHTDLDETSNHNLPSAIRNISVKKVADSLAKADSISEKDSSVEAAAAAAAAKAKADADADAATRAKLHVASKAKADADAASKAKADADAASKAKADADAALKAKVDADAASKAQADADAAAKSKADADAAAKAKADADAAAKAKAEADAAAKSKTDENASGYSGASGALSGLSNLYGTDGDSKGTFFYQEGAAGACGTVNSDSTPLVALPTSLYDGGKHCGKTVVIKNTANGKTVKAKVMDMCPGCPTQTSLDLSTGAYDAIGEQATGVLPIVWGFA